MMMSTFKTYVAKAPLGWEKKIDDDSNLYKYIPTGFRYNYTSWALLGIHVTQGTLKHRSKETKKRPLGFLSRAGNERETGRMMHRASMNDLMTTSSLRCSRT